MSYCKITSVCLSFAAKCWCCFTNALMMLRHYAFSRQHRTQFSEYVYAFVLWRYVAEQIWRVKELFVPGIVASTIKLYKLKSRSQGHWPWCHWKGITNSVRMPNIKSLSPTFQKYNSKGQSRRQTNRQTRQNIPPTKRA